MPARSPPRPPGSARSSRSNCAASSPASPSAPGVHSAWPRGSASCSCGSSCEAHQRVPPRPPRRPPPATNAPLPGPGDGRTATPFARPGAFKVAFQKIHSPTTSRAAGWACGCRLPRPPAARGPPLASAPAGPSSTDAGSLPCWEGRGCRGTAPRDRLPVRHFRQRRGSAADFRRRAARASCVCPGGLVPGLSSVLLPRRRRGAPPSRLGF